MTNTNKGIAAYRSSQYYFILGGENAVKNFYTTHKNSMIGLSGLTPRLGGM
jgi:hypothetical protein